MLSDRMVTLTRNYYDNIKCDIGLTYNYGEELCRKIHLAKIYKIDIVCGAFSDIIDTK